MADTPKPYVKSSDPEKKKKKVIIADSDLKSEAAKSISAKKEMF